MDIAQLRRKGKEDDVIDRLPPHNLEFEQGLLGSILLSAKDSLWEFIAGYPNGERYFYDVRNSDIYAAIVTLANARKPVNTITVSEELNRLGQLPTPEHRIYLAALPDASPSAYNMPYYADALRELFQRRELIRVATETACRAYDGQSDVLEFAESSILAIGRNSVAEEELSMSELSIRVVEQMDSAYVNRGKLVGVPTGFAPLDRMTRGLKPGQMFVIGGRPSHGKTALGLNIAEYAAVDCGISVGIFSLEMTKEELMKRLLCSRARVASDDLENANLSEEEQGAVRNSIGQLSKAPIQIQDPDSITVHQLAARARRMQHRHGIKLLIVDYLQLLHGRNKQNRTQEMTEVSNALKSLAKELQLPLIALAQLNREYDKDRDREPRLSDLRDSGSIEQDADIVALLHPKPGKDAPDNADVPTELLLKKHRNGPTGKISLTFRRSITRFVPA